MKTTFWIETRIAGFLFLVNGLVAQSQNSRPRILSEERIKELLSQPDPDCDLSKTPWNTFNVTVYNEWPDKLDSTVKISPLTRKAFQEPRLSADDERLLNNLKERVKKIEAKGERLPSGKLFPDEKARIDKLNGWIKNMENKEQIVLNTPSSNLQGTELLHLLVAYNVGWNGKATHGDELEGLRDQAIPQLGEIIDSIPCEMKSMRVCADAQPDLHAAWYNTAVIDDSKLSEEKKRELYKRVHILKIGHCLEDYPMSDGDRETLKTACEKWPTYSERVMVNDNDTAYRFIRHRFEICRDALNDFIKKQAGLPLKNGKYIPGTHKN